MKTFREVLSETGDYFAEAKKPLTPEQEALGKLYNSTGGNQGLFAKAAKKDKILSKNKSIKEEPLEFFNDAKRYGIQLRK